MKKIKLVAESLQEWEGNNINEGIFSNEKGLLKAFIEDSTKVKSFLGAFAKQIGQVKGLRNALEKLSDESKMKLAKQAYAALEDPKMKYPKIKIADGKIISAFAVGADKSQTGTNA